MTKAVLVTKQEALTYRVKRYDRKNNNEMLQADADILKERREEIILPNSVYKSQMMQGYNCRVQEQMF